MGYSWQILRAAVEQEIQFPSRKAYEAYIDGLERKGMPYEIIDDSKKMPDGSMVVTMRKRYNPQNAFLRSKPAAVSYTGKEVR